MESNTYKGKSLDDMVFEERNKTYGAFFLRSNYSKYLTKALVIGTLIFTSLIGAAFAYSNASKGDDSELRAIEIDLADLEEIEEPEDELELPPPPPPPEPPPPEIAQVKFLPPEPKADEEVIIEEPPPKVEEVEKAVISSKTVEGEDAISNFAPPPPPPPAITKPAGLGKAREEEIFTTVEQQPEFPGGIAQMYRYIGENMKYPSAAQRANVSGKVFVKFVVEKDGSIGDISILKGIGFGCDEEASRVIKSMPKWSPGRQNGRNVRVYFTMPISFRLE
ncbi:MAG: TonB family protein [Spirosomataceae bacterium]